MIGERFGRSRDSPNLPIETKTLWFWVPVVAVGVAGISGEISGSSKVPASLKFPACASSLLS